MYAPAYQAFINTLLGLLRLVAACGEPCDPKLADRVSFRITALEDANICDGTVVIATNDVFHVRAGATIDKEMGDGLGCDVAVASGVPEPFQSAFAVTSCEGQDLLEARCSAVLNDCAGFLTFRARDEPSGSAAVQSQLFISFQRGTTCNTSCTASFAVTIQRL